VAEAVEAYRDWSASWKSPNGLHGALGELRGKNLACWCRLCAKHAATGKPLDQPCADCAPCHIDVLGPLANAPICEAVP
jgi:hypothetical protein